MRLSASGLDTAAQCIGSVTQPQTAETTGYSAGGTVAARYLEAARTKGKAAALAEAPVEERDYLEAIQLDAIPAGLESEVSVAWNPTTDEGRILGQNLGRAYPYEEGWIYGTADLLGVVEVDGHKRVICPDMKRYQIPRDAADSLQLALYALAAARATGADDAEVSFIVPRYSGDGWIRDVAILDAWALDAAADRIRALVARIESGSSRLHVGPWCRHCGARRGCTAIVGAIELAATADLETLAADVLPSREEVRSKLATLTPVVEGRLYQRIDLLADHLDMLRAVIRERAAEVPLPLADGKELRAVGWSTWKKSDAAKAEQEALSNQLKDRGEIYKVQTQQVRPMKARRA